MYYNLRIKSTSIKLGGIIDDVKWHIVSQTSTQDHKVTVTAVFVCISLAL